jgi:hypothetical protein
VNSVVEQWRRTHDFLFRGSVNLEQLRVLDNTPPDTVRRNKWLVLCERDMFAPEVTHAERRALWALMGETTNIAWSLQTSHPHTILNNPPPRWTTVLIDRVGNGGFPWESLVELPLVYLVLTNDGSILRGVQNLKMVGKARRVYA